MIMMFQLTRRNWVSLCHIQWTKVQASPGTAMKWKSFSAVSWWHGWVTWVPIFYLRLHFSFSPVDILTSTLLLLSIEFTHRLHSPYYLLLLFLDSLTSFYYPSLTTCQFNNYKIFYENCCERLILFAYK